ncbi:hypothetical protein FRB98_002368, partial [Tulasnella sp. 332]
STSYKEKMSDKGKAEVRLQEYIAVQSMVHYYMKSKETGARMPKTIEGMKVVQNQSATEAARAIRIVFAIAHQP